MYEWKNNKLVSIMNKIFSNIGFILLGLGLGLIIAQYSNLSAFLILALAIISLIGGGFLIAFGIKKPKPVEKIENVN